MRPANECDVPVTAYKGIPRHRVIVVRDNGGHARTIHARVRSARKKKKLGNREPTAHKASYRVLPDVLRLHLDDNAPRAAGENLFATETGLPAFKAPPRTFLPLRTCFLLFFSSDSSDFRGETSCGFSGSIFLGAGLRRIFNAIQVDTSAIIRYTSWCEIFVVDYRRFRNVRSLRGESIGGMCECGTP